MAVKGPFCEAMRVREKQQTDLESWGKDAKAPRRVGEERVCFKEKDKASRGGGEGGKGRNRERGWECPALAVAMVSLRGLVECDSCKVGE